MGMVVAGVTATALLALQRRGGAALGHREERAEVERRVPAGVVRAAALDAHPPGPLLQHLDLLERLPQLRLAPDDPHEVLHRFLQLGLDRRVGKECRSRWSPYH